LDGGAPVVVGSLLLAGSDATFGDDSPVSGAITAFFTGYPPVAPDADPSPSGIPGLTHFIIDSLLGRVVKTPPDPEATTLAAARTAKSGATADLPEANEPIDSAAKTVTLTTAAPVKAKKSAAAAVAGKADPKDAQTPAVDPAASAVDPAAAEADDGAGKAEDVTDKIKDGNKTEVDPILLENHTGGGGLAEAIQTWNRFLQKLIGGGGSKKPATVNSTTPTTPKTPQELPEPVAALPSSK
jgi:hypothetical protein